MKFKLIALAVIFLWVRLIPDAQTLSLGGDYGRQSLKPNFGDVLKDVNSVRVNGLVKVAGKTGENGFKFKVGGEYQRTYDVEVFSNYLGTGMDIYRDTNSGFGFGELEYRAGVFGIGARAYLGAEKLHEDLEYVLARKYQFRGTIYIKDRVGITPLFIEFKKQPEGFQQAFGAGVTVTIVK
jgi:hypothetical protein